MKSGTTPLKIEIHDRDLVIDWDDGHRSRFHYLWLRDACRCAHCGEPSFGDRRIVLSEIPGTIAPKECHLSNHSSLVVTWDHEDHRSEYSGEWLRRHCYSKQERERRRFRPTLWDKNAPPDITSFSLPQTRQDETVQYQMFERLHQYGIVFFHDVPADDGVPQTAHLLGYLRETNYGLVSDIRVEPEARTFADLPQAAPLHTDDAFRVFPPGFIMLHAIQPSTDGRGASLFLDGFELVRRLREESPKALEVLTRIPIRFSRLHPDEDDFLLHGKMIRLDPEGETAAVRLGLHNISPPDCDEDDIEAFYDALKRVDRMVRDPSLHIVKRLEAGELVLVDNERVLHGREGFDGSGGRHLRNGFVDRDSFHSRWRVLSKRLGREGNMDWVFPGAR